MGLRDKVKKSVRKAGGGAVKQVKKAGTAVSESVPGYGSYAKQIKKLRKSGQGR